MDSDALLALYDQEIRLGFTPPGAMRAGQEHVVRWLRPAPGTNFIAYCRCEEDQAAAVIEEQVNHLAALGQPFLWAVYQHDRPASLKDRLAATHGLTFEEREAFMALDLRDIPAGLLQPLNADVRRVTRPEQLPDAGAIMQSVWGGNPALRERNLRNDFAVPDYMSVYIGYAGGRPASTGRIYFFPNSHFAVLRGACTLPERRGQGLYTGILAARVQEAAQRGCSYLTVEASTMSATILARHGFQHLEYIDNFQWEGQAKRATVTQDYQAEYPDPILLAQGDVVTPGRRDTEWPGWVWCTDTRGKSGWVPEIYLEQRGETYQAVREYNAAELTVRAGETLALGELVCGWYWATNLEHQGGWVPEKNVALLPD